MKRILWFLLVIVLMIFSSACSLNSGNTDEVNEIVFDSDSPDGLSAFIEVQEPIQQGGRGPIIVKFWLKNISEDPLYLLKWYTPLEGIAGDIFDVTRDGQKVDYVGILAFRGDPTPESYVLLKPGEEVTAEVNISEGYDFSQPGLYTITFRSPLISHIARSEAEMATTVNELGPISIPSNTVTIEITDKGANPFQLEFGPDKIAADTPTEDFQGRIEFPYKTADAGNFILQAGEEVSFRWVDFPIDVDFYTIAIKTHTGDRLIKIGTDFDGSDGVIIGWEVQENISGSIIGFACNEDGTCIGSEWSGEVYSGSLPPDQFCTVKLFNTGVMDVYLEPDIDNQKIATLIPGFYTRVYEILEDQWLWIDLTNTEYSSEEYSSLLRGYVPQQESLAFFGPCDSLIEN